MKDNLALVVTSIAKPTPILEALARGCSANGYQFILIGDEASPADFHLDGCRFYGLAEQYETDLKSARLCPTKHYARKNLGYLIAISQGASIILETDDDNIPFERFWIRRRRQQAVRIVSSPGWINIYRYFSEVTIWPRGFPLDRIKADPPPLESLSTQNLDCPIQQGLTNENPDVDAIYRLTLPLPQSFSSGRPIALTSGSWCPFNSQNTAWWRDAFPLLYLPAYCSFRMTDIWRSFIAQRIAWANNWSLLFHEPDMRQERNAHNLMGDFTDEIPGYLHNETICNALGRLQIPSGVEKIGENLQVCYQKLVSMDLIDPRELTLLAAWLEDLDRVGKFDAPAG